MKCKLFIITLFITMFFSINCFASTPENYYDWADWKDNVFLNYQNPFFSYNLNGQNFQIGYYQGYFQNDGKSCIVKYNNSSQVTYIVFSTSNFVIKGKNGANNNEFSNNASLYDGINSPGGMRGFNEKFSSAANHLYFYVTNTVDTSWGTIVDDHYDFSVTSGTDLFNQLNTLNWTNPESNDSGSLPFMGFTLERKIVPQLSLNVSTTKEIFKWDYTTLSPYKDYPSNYTLEIIGWANFQTINGFEGFDPNNFSINGVNKTVITNGGFSIATNEYSFLYDHVGKAIWSKSGKSWAGGADNTIGNGYMIGIRTKSNDDTESSYYKIFIVQAGGYVRSTGKIVKNDGTVTDTSADNGDDNIGTTTGGAAGYSSNNNTSAQSDPTSDIYDGEGNFNLATIINDLRGMVNALGELPGILTQLLGFLPTQFTALLVLSFSIIITVGVVKLIVR